MAANTGNKYIAGHRHARIINEVSNLILSRSKNRFIVVAIVLECHYPRWRPIWPPKKKNVYIRSEVSCNSN